jgi:hypothetical protein
MFRPVAGTLLFSASIVAVVSSEFGFGIVGRVCLVVRCMGCYRVDERHILGALRVLKK